MTTVATTAFEPLEFCNNGVIAYEDFDPGQQY